MYTLTKQYSLSVGGQTVRTGESMIIQRTYTKTAFESAVALAKAEGHKFLGMTWDAACFTDLIIIRVYGCK